MGGPRAVPLGGETTAPEVADLPDEVWQWIAEGLDPAPTPGVAERPVPPKYGADREARRKADEEAFQRLPKRVQQRLTALIPNPTAGVAVPPPTWTEEERSAWWRQHMDSEPDFRRLPQAVQRRILDVTNSARATRGTAEELWPPPAWAGSAPASSPSSMANVIERATQPYRTHLAPDQEREFQQWVATAKVPFDPGPKSDYDMRGFWQALRGGDPRATTAINPNDGQMHFPDTWKTPHHQTFSDESIYAQPGAPSWHGDVLVAPSGRVIADERPPITPPPNAPLTPSLVRQRTAFAKAAEQRAREDLELHDVDITARPRPATPERFSELDITPIDRSGDYIDADITPGGRGGIVSEVDITPRPRDLYSEVDISPTESEVDITAPKRKKAPAEAPQVDDRAARAVAALPPLPYPTTRW